MKNSPKMSLNEKIMTCVYNLKPIWNQSNPGHNKYILDRLWTEVAIRECKISGKQHRLNFFIRTVAINI